MKLLLMAVLFSFAGELMAADEPPSRILSNGTLQVEVMDPNHPDRYYRGIRFASLANVLQVTRDGQIFLHAPKDHDPLTEAAGLPMEFDIRSPDGPPGFAEAAAGEGFIKIGVGVLAKEDVIYRFFTPYRVVKTAETTVEWHEDRALFRQSCGGVNGYAYRMDSEIRLEGDEVKVLTRLTNTGTKALVTEQYAHDFVSFGDGAVEAGYQAVFSAPFDAKILKPVYEIDGRTVRLTTAVTPAMKAAETVVTPLEKVGFPGGVHVSRNGKGQAFTATVSEPVQSVIVHASGRYFCPEQFITISLAPGESREWSRVYRFELETHQS